MWQMPWTTRSAMSFSLRCAFARAFFRTMTSWRISRSAAREVPLSLKASVTAFIYSFVVNPRLRALANGVIGGCALGSTDLSTLVEGASVLATCDGRTGIG